MNHLVAAQAPDALSSLGESGLIEKIRSWLGPVSPPSPAGIGDDCALLPTVLTGRQIITTDTVSFGHHFDETATAHDAGAKLIKRNLSDIAAMGGTPGPAVLALLCGPNLSISWMEGFFAGVRTQCMRHKIDLVGGDVSSLPAGQFSAVLTLTGSASSPKLRHQTQIGDQIYVTGTLGGSILGKHITFEPRISEGQWLATRPDCHAMMDLTDGLGKDLPSLLSRGQSAAIRVNQLPLSAAAEQCARASGLTPEEHAFCDGEDYELLFTVNGSAKTSCFEAEWHASFPTLKLSCIGSIREMHLGGILIDAQTNLPLPWSGGFEHLKA